MQPKKLSLLRPHLIEYEWLEKMTLIEEVAGADAAISKGSGYHFKLTKKGGFQVGTVLLSCQKGGSGERIQVFFCIREDLLNGKDMFNATINPSKESFLYEGSIRPFNVMYCSSLDERIVWNSFPIADVSAIGRKFPG